MSENIIRILSELLDFSGKKLLPFASGLFAYALVKACIETETSDTKTISENEPKDEEDK